MKNELHLDALFSEAKTAPVKYTFEETKASFLTQIVSQTSVPKSKPSISPKNWIIMITSISIITAVALIFTNHKEQAKTIKAGVYSTKEAVYDQKVAQNLTEIESVDTKVEPSKKIKNTHLNSIILKPKRAFSSSILSTAVLNRTGIILPKPKSKFAYNEEEYFPKLTHEEIAANYKQKKKMLKALTKYDKKSYAYIPAGSFDYNGEIVSCQSFFMQTTEVTNLEYRTFLFDLLIQERKEEFKIARPDQHLWVSLIDENQKVMEEMYFSDAAYNNYPVVNISRAGAELYCKWLNQELQKYLPPSERNLHNDVRLPTRIEWVKAASNEGKQLPFAWDSDSVKNATSCYLGNYMPQPGRYFDDGGFHTVNVTSYTPNAHGLYNMSGNAAEMVYGTLMKNGLPYENDQGYGTAGGGWMSTEEEIKIYGPDPYKGLKEGRPDVGFRVVMTHLGRNIIHSMSGTSNFIDSENRESFNVTNQTRESDFEEFAKYAESQGWEFTWKTKYSGSKLRFLELELSDKKGKNLCGEVYFKTNYFGQTELSLNWAKNLAGITVFDIVTKD